MASETLSTPMSAKKPPRPNYRYIHRHPLPIETHPLPPLIPHNPLSLLSIFVAYLSQLIYPPKRAVYSAYFDAATCSVQVTDGVAVRALWEMGFFGKGSLSRSEPTWLDRERVRRGVDADLRSEHITAKRRDERKEWKLERARKEREAVAHQLKTEREARRQAGVDGTENETSRPPADVIEGYTLDLSSLGEEGKRFQSHVAATTFDENTNNTGGRLESKLTADNEIHSENFNQSSATHERLATPNNPLTPSSPFPMPENANATTEITNEEHLQLSLEEALFLAYGLGVLHVYDSGRPDAKLLSPPSLLSLFRSRISVLPKSSFPPVPQPDDPFLLSYVVYHHFRSLGWVVRSGVKFGTDYLLYNRGPVFSHAEFAIVILPAYSHPDWTRLAVDRGTCGHPRKTWWWLHCVNRVQAQVKKSLVLVYVEVPPVFGSGRDDNIGDLLRSYKIREFTIRRWVPNRMRD